MQTSGMGKVRRARDFFISYTQDDRGWAEWIAWAWQLEAEATRPCCRPGTFALAKLVARMRSVGDLSQRRGTNHQKGRARRLSEESRL
jgi:hypothetical protein